MGRAVYAPRAVAPQVLLILNLTLTLTLTRSSFYGEEDANRKAHPDAVNPNPHP